MSAYGVSRGAAAVGDGFATVAARLGGGAWLVAGAVKHVARNIARRREITVLGQLDDYMLRDIGITRADLRDATASPFFADPTRVLVHRCAERQAGEVGRRHG